MRRTGGVVLLLTGLVSWGVVASQQPPPVQGGRPNVERTLFWRTRAGHQVQRAVRSGEWKLIVDGNHPMVFNLATDIGERRDLANRRQDVARRLQGLLEEWERDVDGEARTNAPAAAVQ